MTLAQRIVRLCVSRSMAWDQAEYLAACADACREVYVLGTAHSSLQDARGVAIDAGNECRKRRRHRLRRKARWWYEVAA